MLLVAKDHYLLVSLPLLPFFLLQFILECLIKLFGQGVWVILITYYFLYLILYSFLKDHSAVDNLKISVHLQYYPLDSTDCLLLQIL